MGRMSRSKGARGERELAKVLSDLWQIEAKRGQQHAGGSDSPDVKTSLSGLHIEVKRSETFQLYKSLSQASQDASEGQVPIVMHRKNGKPWVAVLELDRVLDLVRALREVADDQIPW